MFMYYIEFRVFSTRPPELHQANCWYFLKQKINNYNCIGSFESYDSALLVARFQINTKIKPCPFCQG